MRLQYATSNPSFLASIPTLVNFSEKDDMKIFSAGDSIVSAAGDKDAKGAAASVGGIVGKGLSPTDILWRVKCDFAQVRLPPSLPPIFLSIVECITSREGGQLS